MQGKVIVEIPCFQNSNGGILKVSNYAIRRMQTFIQDQPYKMEAGGVLLGRFIVDSSDVVVDDVTIPMAGDIRRRNRYYRQSPKHQEAIDNAWTRSNQRCNYLGGWHTHPEFTPSFSRIDKKDWKRALNIEQFDNNVMYFVIIGIGVLRVWEGQKGSGKISPLRPLNTSGE